MGDNTPVHLASENREFCLERLVLDQHAVSPSVPLRGHPIPIPLRVIVEQMARQTGLEVGEVEALLLGRD